MKNSNRWAEEQYPEYRDEVNDAIGFSGLGVDYFLKGKAESALALLGKHLGAPETKSCLDIGCGIGAMHPALVGRIGQLSAVDVSKDAIETAKTANPDVRYAVYDGSRLPYENGAFDMTLTVCVMHHVPPPQWPQFVAEAWRVTRPGGLFAVFEHNPLNPLTKLAVMRCPFDHDAVLLWPRKVKALMVDQGFEAVDRDFLFFVPLKSGLAKKIDRALTWLPLGAQYVLCGRRPG